MVDVSFSSQANFQLISMFSQEFQLSGRVSQQDGLAAQQIMQSFAGLFAQSGYSAGGFGQNLAQFQPRPNFQSMLPAPGGYDASQLMTALALIQGGGLFGKSGMGGLGGMMGGMGGLGGLMGGFGGMQQLGGGIQGMGVSMQMLMMRIDIGGVPGNGIRTKPPENDPFATHQGCRTGLDNPTRMTDQTLLVVNDILQNNSTSNRGGHKAMTFEEMQQKVFEKTGEKPEITMVKTKSGDEIKALKFKDGSIVGDGAGDGKIDTGDYNFKGAIEDMKTRLGVDDAGIKGLTEGIYNSHTEDKQMREGIEKAFPGFKDLPPEIQNLGFQLLGHTPHQPGEDVLSGLMQDMRGNAGQQAQISIFMLSMQSFQYAQ